MVTRADLTGTRPVTPVEAAMPVRPVGDAREDSLHRLTQLAVGKQFQAEVVKQIANNNFMIRIEGAEARVNLPEGTRVGDKLPMTLLSTSPRPALLLGADADQANTTLSSTGRLIDTVLSLAQRQGGSTVVNGRAPLLAQAPLANSPALGPQVATVLRDAVGSSGVFYESHLQQWAEGKHSLQALGREPQTQTPRALDAVTLAYPALARLVSQISEARAGGQSLAQALQSPEIQAAAEKLLPTLAEARPILARLLAQNLPVKVRTETLATLRGGASAAPASALAAPATTALNQVATGQNLAGAAITGQSTTALQSGATGAPAGAAPGGAAPAQIPAQSVAAAMALYAATSSTLPSQAILVPPMALSTTLSAPLTEAAQASVFSSESASVSTVAAIASGADKVAMAVPDDAGTVLLNTPLSPGARTLMELAKAHPALTGLLMQAGQPGNATQPAAILWQSSGMPALLEQAGLELTRPHAELQTLLQANAAPSADSKDALVNLPLSHNDSSASLPTDADTLIQTSTPEGIGSDAMQTINQQLHTLEHRQLQWSGELWPGQKFEWEIQEDTPQSKDSAKPDASWQSTVRFDMPTLGKISAHIRLTGERLQMHISVADEATAERLRAHGARLVNALEAAGSPLDALLVKPHD